MAAVNVTAAASLATTIGPILPGQIVMRERDTLGILFLRNEATILLKTKENANKTKLTAYPLWYQGDNFEIRAFLRHYSHVRKGPISGLFRSIPGRSTFNLFGEILGCGHDGLHSSMSRRVLTRYI
jgi:hypothetical protein